MKTIAISGMNGFLGSYLRDEAIKQGSQILYLNRDMLYDPVNLLSKLQVYHPDVIIHCASYGNMHDHTNEESILAANVNTTFNLIKASKDLPYQAFVYISSSSVLLEHQTLYSATKASGEALCRWMVDEYHKPLVVMRPTTIIGKGDSQKHLIPTLIRSCLQGEEMPFIPTPTHDYINVNDVTSAIFHVIDHIKESQGETYNISSEVMKSNEEIKLIVEHVTQKKANVKLVNQLRKYDTESWRIGSYDLRALGWKPTIGLVRSIESMI